MLDLGLGAKKEELVPKWSQKEGGLGKQEVKILSGGKMLEIQEDPED